MHEMRKVQETHKRTLIISLPKKWRERFPVQGGDQVLLSLQGDGILLVRPSGSGGPRFPCVTAVAGGAAQAKSRLSALYIGGAPGVLVEGCAAADLEGIRAHVLAFIGAELVEESAGSLAVQFLGGESRFTAPRALQRLWALAQGNMAGTPVEPTEVSRLHGYLLRVGHAPSDGSGTETGAAQAIGLLRVAEALAMVATTSLHPVAPGDAAALAAAVDAYTARDVHAARALASSPPIAVPAGLVPAAARAITSALLQMDP